MALVPREDSTHPEICQFHHRTLSIVDDEENVAWLQVAVDDAIGVQIIQSLDDLANDWRPIIADERSVVPPLDEVDQCSIAELSHERSRKFNNKRR